jgi:hypothetical protein
VLCLKLAIASNNSLWLSNTDSGNLLNNAGNVVYTVMDGTLSPLALPCTLNTTKVLTTGKVTPTVGNIAYSVTTASGIDRGIASGTSSTYTLSHPAGATVTFPICDSLKVTCSQSNPTSTLTVVTLTAVPKVTTPAQPGAVVSKSKLDITQCILEEADVTPLAGAYANTGTWTGSYVNCAQTAGQNTIKSAPVTINVAGVAGPTALTFVQTVTSSVKLWDQTRGACKIADQDSRAISCKGDWGAVVPLNISVRKGSPITGGAPYGNPAGLNDPSGVSTPLPVLIASGNIL